ncbi:caspase family protein [Leptolyngbya sp. AN02str]|uniref:caspase family protein n=1 Tax=Leptolyngbya sp. AN02str TaxID=3423363 RepID=UPI003D31C054
MPRMKRRHFLQVAGSTLATIGLSQLNIVQQADQYGKALAQSTPRKLALLVGINQYPNSTISNLSGCLNDVNMQYELLVHRFGFHPRDVLILKDDAELLPTRANILQAFEEHLIAQARPGDVVVFHYSGHGSLVTDPNPITVAQCGNNQVNGLNGTLVPRDASRQRQAESDIVVPDITGRSLFLLTRRLDTDHVTMVLDSCFAGAGTRGNARVRSATGDRLTNRTRARLLPSPEELENQERWLRELNLPRDRFQQLRELGIAKGLALGSASCNQQAYELPFDVGYTAGAFSYLLTSYLWQATSGELADTTKVNLIRSTRLAVQRRGVQVPLFEAAPNSGNLTRPIYFTSAPTPYADAVVQAVTGSRIQLWLGGVAEASLKMVRPGTVYSSIDAAGHPIAEVVVESRVGLVAEGRLAEGQSVSVRSGMLLREKLLAIPTPTLRIGVDSSLGTDQAIATSALQTVLQGTAENDPEFITVLPINQQTDLEYILVRVTEGIRNQLDPALNRPLPPIGAIALFSADLSRVIPNTLRVNESVEVAIQQLQSRFKALLVTKVLQELAGMSSDLRVSGSIATVSGNGPVISIVSRGGEGGRSPSSPTSQVYRSGETFQIQITNAENEPVYLSSLVIDGYGDIIALHPARWDAPDEAARIDQGESLTVPRAEDGVRFRIALEEGSDSAYIEVLTLVSRQPLRGLLRNLQAIAAQRTGASQNRGAVGFGEGDSIRLLNNLLGDVNEISRGATVLTEAVDAADTAVDSQAIAAFSTLIEVIP